MSDNPEVNATRRRKGEKPTKRAEAPVRRETGSGPVRPSSVGTTYRPTSAGGTSMPSMGKMGGCGGGLVVVLLVLYLIFSGGLGGGGEQTAVEEPVFEKLPLRSSRPELGNSSLPRQNAPPQLHLLPDRPARIG